MPVSRGWINQQLKQRPDLWRALNDIANAHDALERASGQAPATVAAPGWTITGAAGRYLHAITPPAAAPLLQYEAQSSADPSFNPRPFDVTGTASTGAGFDYTALQPGPAFAGPLPAAGAFRGRVFGAALDVILDLGNFNAIVIRLDGRAGNAAGQALKIVSDGAWTSIGSPVAPVNATTLGGWHAVRWSYDESGEIAVWVDGVLRTAGADDSLITNWQARSSSRFGSINSWLGAENGVPQFLSDDLRDLALGVGQTAFVDVDPGAFKYWRLRWRVAGGDWGAWSPYLGGSPVAAGIG